MNLYDKRNDIIDIAKAPKVLWLYRGDTFTVELDLKISSEEISAVVFNVAQLSSSIELSLIESEESSSKWLLTINSINSTILDMKQHDFTMSVIDLDGKILTLYKGILNVNNPIYSNNPYLLAVISEVSPTQSDTNHPIGKVWVNTTLNTAYTLNNIINDNAIWKEITNDSLLNLISAKLNVSGDNAAVNIKLRDTTFDLGEDTDAIKHSDFAYFAEEGKTNLDAYIDSVQSQLDEKLSSADISDEYYTKTQIDDKLDTKSNVGHGHIISDVEGLQSELDSKLDDIQKGAPNGLAELDANSKVPLSQLPDASKSQTYVQATFEALPTNNVLTGDKGFVTTTGDSYIWDGSEWKILADADWQNVNLDWVNIINPPIASGGTSLKDATLYTTAQTDSLLNTKSNVGHTHIESDITDLDKYTQSQVDDLLDTKSNVGHTHVEADITDLDKYTQSQVDTLLSGKSNVGHTHIESDITDLDKYTQSQVDTLLEGKSNVGHTHIEEDITDLDKYTQEQVDSFLSDKIDLNGENSELTKLRFVNGEPGLFTEVQYNNDWKGLEIVAVDGTTLQVGGELWFVNGKNIGDAITHGDVAQFVGSQGNHYLFKKAVASEVNQFPQSIIGIATQDIATNTFGKITWFGEVGDINTNVIPTTNPLGAQVGDILYFDTQNGGLRVGKPAAFPYIQLAAIVKLSTGNASNGRLLVRPQFISSIATDIQVVDANENFNGSTIEEVLEELFNTKVSTSKLGGTEEGNIPLLDEFGLIAAQYLGDRYTDVFKGYGVFDLTDAQVPKLLDIYPPDQWDLVNGQPIPDAIPFPYRNNTIYVTLNITENTLYRYIEDTEEFIGLAPSPLGLGTTTGTAYPGNEGQANRDAITGLIDGTVIANKATNDKNGNDIPATYATQQNFQGHLADLSNPHAVTTAQIGAEPAFTKNTAFNKNFGNEAGTVAEGNHLHTGVYEPVFTKNTAFNKNFGTNEGEVAQGNHLHTGVYEPANENIQQHINATNNPHSVNAEQVGLGSVLNYGIATQGEAASGTVNNKYMTPLRTAEAIAAIEPKPHTHDDRYYTETEVDTRFDTVNTRLDTLESLNQILGVRWDSSLSTPVLTRTDVAVGLTVSTANGYKTSDFDSYFPYSQIRRCNLDDDGIVNAYYGDPDYIEDGTNGQVMVEIPKFYYKHTLNGTVHDWKISPTQLAGYKLHPAFESGDKVLDKFYIGAFEGNGTTLQSIAGVSVDVSQTIGTFRTRAQNRGTGWNIQTFTQTSAIQLLYLIEYANYNSQSVIGNGVTNAGDKINTGTTIGNQSYGTTIGNQSYGTAMSYRGIENFYGNVFKFVDGLIVTDDGYYYDNVGFNDTALNYQEYATSPITTDGFIRDIIFDSNFDFAWLGTNTTGSSTTYLTDRQFSHDTGEVNIALFGGSWFYESLAGAFNWALNDVSASANSDIGVRLSYNPF